MSEDGRASGATEWSGWLRLAQAGDAAAYQQFLRAVVPYLATIARAFFHQPDAVDDAVQDILLIVHSVRHTYEPGRPVKPWLATIARRHCIDLQRRRQRRNQREGADNAALDTQPADTPSPEEAMHQVQLSREVREAVDALPPSQRTALRLMKLDGLSAREASERSGMSVSAIKVACHRALRALGGKRGDESR